MCAQIQFEIPRFVQGGIEEGEEFLVANIRAVIGTVLFQFAA